MDMLPVKLQKYILLTFDDSRLTSYRITDWNNTTIISLIFQHMNMADQGESSQPLQAASFRRKPSSWFNRDMQRPHDWFQA